MQRFRWIYIRNCTFMQICLGQQTRCHYITHYTLQITNYKKTLCHCGGNLLVSCQWFFFFHVCILLLFLWSWWNMLRCGRLKPKSRCCVENPLLQWDFLTYFCFLVLSNPHNKIFSPPEEQDYTSCPGLVNVFFKLKPISQIGNSVHIITTHFRLNFC